MSNQRNAKHRESLDALMAVTQIMTSLLASVHFELSDRNCDYQL